MTGNNLPVEGKHKANTGARTHTHTHTHTHTLAYNRNARGTRVTQDAFRLCKYRAPVALHNENAPQTFIFL